MLPFDCVPTTNRSMICGLERCTSTHGAASPTAETHAGVPGQSPQPRTSAWPSIAARAGFLGAELDAVAMAPALASATSGPKGSAALTLSEAPAGSWMYWG